MNISAISQILLWVLVIFNLLLTLALVKKANSKGEQESGLKKGTKAPHFQAENLIGEKIDSQSYLGSSLLLVFVSPTCRPCREALPYYLEVGQQAHQNRVNFAFVIMAELEQATAFAQEFNLTLPALVAPSHSNSLISDYKVTTTPSFCLVNSNGFVEATGYPGVNTDGWKHMLNNWQLTSEKEPLEIK